MTLVAKGLMGTSNEDHCAFTIVSRWIFLRMRNVSYKICRENQNTHFMFNNLLPRIVSERTQMTIRRMRFTCLISKATDTHSEYEILIAFLQQQWLRERASMLHYTYSAGLVCILFTSSR